MEVETPHEQSSIQSVDSQEKVFVHSKLPIFMKKTQFL